MTQPTFGITFTREDNEARPVVGADLSVGGLTGPMADAAGGFPLNEPVAINTTNHNDVVALGATNLIADAVRGINDQLGPFQRAARVIVVRTPHSTNANAVTARAEDTAAVVGDSALGTGVHAHLRAGSLHGVTARLHAFPGLTGWQSAANTANPICAAIPSVMDRLLAHAIVDGPGTTKAAALSWRETIQSDRIIPVDPAVIVFNAQAQEVTRPVSGRLIGVAIRRDFEKGGKPFHSWANQPVRGVVRPSRPIGFSLTDGATEAQELLANNIGVIIAGEGGVEDAIASGGFVYIGTDNAGEDELWRFYNVMRGRDYIHLTYLRNLRYYLGRYNLDGHTLQSVANSMNFVLRDLQAGGHIIGYAPIEFPVDRNPSSSLRQGIVGVRFRAEEAPVLRRIDIFSARYAKALDDMLAGVASQLVNAA